MKKVLTLIFLIILSYVSINAQQKATLTDSLVRNFSKAWNENNLPKMLSLIQPDAFFKSPYQLRYGRDTMAATVLKSNPPAFRNTKTVELFSKVKENVAWSIGRLTSNIFDDVGNDTGKLFNADYTYLFTRNNSGDWKLQMMVFHEE